MDVQVPFEGKNELLAQQLGDPAQVPQVRGEAKCGETTNVLIAEPSWPFTDAECTRSEFSASTPAALESNPRRSGAIIVTL